MLPDDTIIEIHSKAGCPFCDRAKALLAQKGLAYTEIRHDDDVERQAFYDRLGLAGAERTVPQVILIDGQSGERFRVGGYRELTAMLGT